MGLLRITSDQLKGIFELEEGQLKVGRSRDNNIRLAHKSVSRHHAIITEEPDGRLLIKDLASTYGSYINEDKITEGYAEDGDIIRLGRIRLAYQTSLDPVPPGARPLAVTEREKEEEQQRQAEETAQSPAAPAPIETPDRSTVSSSLIKPCDRHPENNVSLICPKCHLKFCTECVKPIEVSGMQRQLCPYCKEPCHSIERHQAALARQRTNDRQTFFHTLPGAFKYPFTAEGIWLLLIGTVLYVALAYTAQFDLRVAIVAGGYLLAYLHKLVVAAASGEEEMPGWPEFSDWWQEIVRPCLMIAGCGLVSFLPMLLYLYFTHRAGDDIAPSVLFASGAFGLLYLPLSILAVAMSQDFIRVNPITIVHGMIRLSGQFMTLAVLLMLMVVAHYLLCSVFATYVTIAPVSLILSGLVSIYFLAVFVRMLGNLYYVNRRELAWADA